MDSVKVLLERIAQESTGFWGIFVDLLTGVGPLVVAILVPWFTLRHTLRLKQMDMLNAEEDRRFQLEREISKKSVEVMGRSYHLTHRINRDLSAYWQADPPRKQEIIQDVRSAREYWEENLFYLPLALRRRVIPLTNLTFVSFQPAGQNLNHDAFQQVSEMFAGIEGAFARLMEEFNLFNNLGDIDGADPNK